MFLLDSDAAKKLCQFDLLDFLLNSLECKISDLAILPQLRFQLRLGDHPSALKKLGSTSAVNNAIRLVEFAAEVEISANSANPILTLDRTDLDSGEITLFAALSEREKSSLLSGDKRAYIALSKIHNIEIIDSLWLRLICLEEALLIIIKKNDFAEVSQRIRENPNVDTAISLAFGNSYANSIDQVRSALGSYLTHLEKNTNGKYISNKEINK